MYRMRIGSSKDNDNNCSFKSQSPVCSKHVPLFSVFTKKPSFLREFSRTLPTLFFFFTKRCFISIQLNQKRRKRSRCSYYCCNTYTYASLLLVTSKTNRIYHRSSMQAEKSQPDGKRIMPEMRLTSFPALSVDPRVGISRSTSETYD